MRRKETIGIAITGVFVAILLLQTFVPNIGYIRIIPTLPAITTVPLTMAIYAILMGPKSGLLFGLFWGVTRLFRAYTQPLDLVSLLLFQNVFIAVVPSVLAGWLPGLIAKFGKGRAIFYAISGAVAALANTFGVITLASLIFMNNSSQLVRYLGNSSGSHSLFIILITALGVNGLVEAVFTAIMTPIIAKPLKYVIKKHQI